MRIRAAVVVGFLALLAVASRGDVSALASQGAAVPHDIDSLVAPIALYPDQLLSQILICAGDPASVTKLNGWLRANKALKGTELQDPAVLAGFEPSFVALALFPTV